MKYSYIIIIFLLSVNITCNGQKKIALQLTAIKTTLLETGVLSPQYDIKSIERKYKNARFLLRPSKNQLLICSEEKNDTIFLSSKRRIKNIVDNEILRKYPTDNIEDCFKEKGGGCEISKTLQSLISKKDTYFYYSVGRPNDFEYTNNRYILFYLNNNNYALLSDNEFALLLFKK